MKIKYSCGHVIKSNWFPGTKSVDCLCPYCQKAQNKLDELYEFEEKNHLDHFVKGSLQNRYIAADARQRLLLSIHSSWVDDPGLLEYKEFLLTDLRPNADTFLDRVNKVLFEDYYFWFIHRNDTRSQLIEFIELGDCW